MPPVQCPRCNIIVNVDDVPESFRQRAAACVQSGSVVSAVRLLHSEAGQPLGNAKALAQHLAKRPGLCQRCGRSIGTAELASCSKCKALTVSW